MIVLTNLHNPSSVLAPESALRAVGDLARSVSAHVLVDEVYLDAVYTDTPKSSFHLGPEFIVTTSLTKVYGLGGLRCGWILAQPDLARSMWRLKDLFAPTPVHPAELLSVIALENLDRIRERGRKIVEADRAMLAEFLAEQTLLSAPHTDFGTTAVLRLANGDVETFLEKLRIEQETLAVPGRFFDLPNHFRIGMGVNSEMFREGLRRIGQDFKNSPPKVTGPQNAANTFRRCPGSFAVGHPDVLHLGSVLQIPPAFALLYVKPVDRPAFIGENLF